MGALSFGGQLGFVMFFDRVPKQVVVNVFEVPTPTGDLVKVIGQRIKIDILTQQWLGFEHVVEIRLSLAAVRRCRSDRKHLLSTEQIFRCLHSTTSGLLHRDPVSDLLQVATTKNAAPGLASGAARSHSLITHTSKRSEFHSKEQTCWAA